MGLLLCSVPRGCLTIHTYHEHYVMCDILNNCLLKDAQTQKRGLRRGKKSGEVPRDHTADSERERGGSEARRNMNGHEYPTAVLRHSVAQ